MIGYNGHYIDNVELIDSFINYELDKYEKINEEALSKMIINNPLDLDRTKQAEDVGVKKGFSAIKTGIRHIIEFIEK
jgi:hypothetical protein